MASTFSVEATETLAMIMRVCSTPQRWNPKEARQAAVALQNRAHGMPSQPLTGGAGQPLEQEFPTLLGALQKLAGETPPGEG